MGSALISRNRTKLYNIKSLWSLYYVKSDGEAMASYTLSMFIILFYSFILSFIFLFINLFIFNSICVCRNVWELSTVSSRFGRTDAVKLLVAIISQMCCRLFQNYTPRGNVTLMGQKRVHCNENCRCSNIPKEKKTLSIRLTPDNVQQIMPQCHSMLLHEHSFFVFFLCCMCACCH